MNDFTKLILGGRSNFTRVIGGPGRLTLERCHDARAGEIESDRPRHTPGQAVSIRDKGIMVDCKFN